MKYHITTFVRRQTPESQFSHWAISDEELLQRIEAGFPKAERGYRDGVLLVPVDPEGFFSSVVQLQPGQCLLGEYRARREGEEPRKSTFVPNAQKLPAKRVDIVLYSHTVLLEKMEHETQADYEIVSVNACPTLDPMPIPTGTLIANHLELSGGTATKMTDAEFVSALRESVAFWKDKATVAPEEFSLSPGEIVRAFNSSEVSGYCETQYNVRHKVFDLFGKIFFGKAIEQIETDYLKSLLKG